MSEGGAEMPEGYIPPNVAPKCTWALGKDKSLSPHRHLPTKWVHTHTPHFYCNTNYHEYWCEVIVIFFNNRVLVKHYCLFYIIVHVHVSLLMFKCTIIIITCMNVIALCFFFPTCSDLHMSTSILPDILSMIGNTPLVRLDKIAKNHGLECELRTWRWQLVNNDIQYLVANEYVYGIYTCMGSE